MRKGAEASWVLSFSPACLATLQQLCPCWNPGGWSQLLRLGSATGSWGTAAISFAVPRTSCFIAEAFIAD